MSLFSHPRKVFNFSINQAAKPFGEFWPEGGGHVSREPGIARLPAQTRKPTTTPVQGNSHALDPQHQSLHSIEPMRVANLAAS
jgi:hypothetical protein